MTPTAEPLDLGIDLAAFDPATSVSLRDACRDYFKGRDGRPLSLNVARGYARQGVRPLGPDGPLLVLPAVLWSNQLRTMPEWAFAFERERVRLALERLRRRRTA